MDSPAEKKLTPMLAKYRSIKSRYPDALILFRLGDFYEMFEADAKIGARELELALTGRSFAKGVRLPMAGAARIGLTDRVFTRVGASDDIARGARRSWSR